MQTASYGSHRYGNCASCRPADPTRLKRRDKTGQQERGTALTPVSCNSQERPTVPYQRRVWWGKQEGLTALNPSACHRLQEPRGMTGRVVSDLAHEFAQHWTHYMEIDLRDVSRTHDCAKSNDARGVSSSTAFNKNASPTFSNGRRSPELPWATGRRWAGSRRADERRRQQRRHFRFEHFRFRRRHHGVGAPVGVLGSRANAQGRFGRTRRGWGGRGRGRRGWSLDGRDLGGRRHRSMGHARFGRERRGSVCLRPHPGRARLGRRELVRGGLSGRFRRLQSAAPWCGALHRTTALWRRIVHHAAGVHRAVGVHDERVLAGGILPLGGAAILRICQWDHAL